MTINGGKMKIGVVYVTKTKNTEKLAKAVAEVCDVEAMNIVCEHNLEDVDCLFIGASIYRGKPAPEIFEYVENLPANRIKNAVLFSSSASGRERTELLVNNLRSKGINVYPNHFMCKAKFLFFNNDRPNNKDIQNIKVFTQKVLDELSK